MRLTFALLFLALLGNAFAVLQSVEEMHASITGVEIIPGEKLRAYQINYFPDNAPRVVEAKGIEIRKSGDTVSIDAVTFVVNTILQSTIGFGYFSASADIPQQGNNSDVSNVRVAAFGFLARAFRVFEFVETNNQPGFQPGIGGDQVTGQYDLSHLLLQWKPITFVSSNVTTAEGTFPVFTISVETLDEVFLFRMTVAGTPIQIGQTRINPNTVKVDFKIKWFNNTLHSAANPWTTGPSNNANAQVGLLVGTASAALAAAAKRNDPVTSRPQITFLAGEFLGFFTWEDKANAILTGAQAIQAVAVRDTVVEDDASISAAFIGFRAVRVIFFAFDGIRPSEVGWDPEIGMSQEISASSALSLNSSLLLISLIALLLASKRN